MASNATPVIQQSYTAGENQHWVFSLVGTAAYDISNVLTDRSLIVRGNLAQIYEYNTASDLMKFKLYNVGDNRYRIQNLSNGLWLSVSATGDPTAETQLVGESVVSDDTRQLFQLQSVGTVGLQPDTEPLLYKSPYPNPFSDKLFFELPSLSIGKITLRLFDLSGQTHYVKSFDMLDGTTICCELPGNLSAGIYLYQIMDSAGNSYTGKVIKQ